MSTATKSPAKSSSSSLTGSTEPNCDGLNWYPEDAEALSAWGESAIPELTDGTIQLIPYRDTRDGQCGVTVAFQSTEYNEPITFFSRRAMAQAAAEVLKTLAARLEQLAASEIAW